MSEENNDFMMEEAADDVAAVEFIRQRLPQELQEKFSDDELFYFLDVIAEYYFNLDESAADQDGAIDIDLDEVAKYVVDKAAKDRFGKYDPEDLYFVVDAEMDYAELPEDEQ